MPARPGSLPQPAAPSATDRQLGDLAGRPLRARRRAVLAITLGAKLVGAAGLAWDIRWHVLIGRDTFWIPPHLMIYAAVSLVAALAFGLLFRETLDARGGAAPPGTLRISGLVGTRGTHLVAWGVALTLCAAPVDDFWHRLFGLDVTLWSPPHLLGIAGAQVSTFGCLVMAGECWPRGSRAHALAVITSGALLLGMFWVVADPGQLTAYRRGGVFFFTWGILGAALFGFTLTIVAGLGGARRLALAAGVATFALHLFTATWSDVGMAILDPPSQIVEAIKEDPGAPIALAWEIARKNGEPQPGHSRKVRLVATLAGLLLAALPLVSRPLVSGAVHGAVLAALGGTLIAQSPAFAPVRPGAAAAVAALALAALAGAGGAWLAARARNGLEPDRT